MTLDDSTSRWIDVLAVQRAEHLANLYSFSRNCVLAAVGFAGLLLAAVVLGLEELWEVTFEDLALASALANAAAVGFAAACALVVLAFRQQRRDRSAAIAAIDRVIPQLLAGTDPQLMLGQLSERMRRISPPEGLGEPDPYLPSLLEGRWLGSRARTKVFLACTALVLAALCLAGALVLAVPPDSDDEGDTTGTPAAFAPGAVEFRPARSTWSQEDPTMQYMLLICDDEKNLARMSDARRAEIMKEYGQFIEDIVKSGEFRAGGQLQLSSSATTVRLKNGKRITTDGPFAETKEQIGGYFLVECKDLDAALAIAARVPSARAGGSIEVRPLVPTSVAARTPPAV